MARAARAKAEEKKTVTVVQTGSPIGRRWDQEATLKGLGLNKLHRRRTLEDTPSVQRNDQEGQAPRPSRRGIGTRISASLRGARSATRQSR